ncbi:unnamed protein product [Bemisia tabaci]|uniref:Uncharacterized protein n=1 Tax=Bemisia tabaci TaxID=7038 RepID=A0A9P0CAC7_BEMTA|nr:unnamed protein product [Bemisia tabaci]
MLRSTFIPGLIGAIALASSASGTEEGLPNFPKDDGFPSNAPPGSDNETEIYQRAFGTRPNGAPAKNLTEDDFTSLQIIVFTGIFEVAYFVQLIYNITNNVTGYEIDDPDERSKTIAELTAIQSQEEVHVLQARYLLLQNDRDPIRPCQYITPVSNLKDAIRTIYKATALLLGTLQEIIYRFGFDARELVKPSSAISENEAEQAAFFRQYLGYTPTSTPYLTGATRSMAYSAVQQNYIMPGSCPNSFEIELPIFGVLGIVAFPDMSRKDNQTIQLFVPGHDTNVIDGLSICYAYQQNVPPCESLTDAHVDQGYVYFLANYPTALDTFGLKGLVIGVLVNSTDNVTDVDSLDPYILYGPLLIAEN